MERSGGTYEPELGQALFATQAWGDYAMPRYASALLQDLLSEIDRVYWNTHQKEWGTYDDPEIPGITYRPYWWGGDEAPEAMLPNFAFEDVEIRWYKHSGRNDSVNRELTPEQWAGWYERALSAIWKADLRLPAVPLGMEQP